MSNYGSINDFKAYHTARGRDYTTITDPVITSALLLASEWLDAKYRSQFPGLKVDERDQVREWPRDGGQDIYGYAISPSSVPTEVLNATFEAAAKHIDEPGSLTIDFKPSKYKRAAVDGAVNVEFMQFSSAHEAQIMFPVIEQILDPILTGNGVGSTSSLSGKITRV